MKNSALAAGAFAIVPRRVLGRGFLAPSDVLTLGFIGLGKQSKGLIDRFIKQTTGVRVLAGSDIFESKRKWFTTWVEQKYAEKAVAEVTFKDVQTYQDYQELLQRSDIDAVVIATPDHWHAIQSIDAMKAGKDVYCEKPLAHTVKEGRMIAKAVEKYAKILQTGSMQRSNDNFRKACELVRNGYVGKITKILVSVGDPAIPYNLQAETVPAGCDWDRWCGPAPLLPYHHTLAPDTVDSSFWPQWRTFQETGGGGVSDWGAHMFDIAQWAMAMDESGPVQFIPPAEKGAKRGLRMIYANGVEMVHEDFGRGNAVRFIGTEGTLDISRQFLDSRPDTLVTATIKDSEVKLYQSTNHYQDWLDAVKTRKQPICSAETGHRSSSVCNIANIAYRLNRPLTWDPAKEKFRDAEANKLSTKKYRKPYLLGRG